MRDATESAGEYLEEHWQELKRDIQHHWDRIDDADLMIIGGDEAAFIGNLQAIYRVSRDEAERQYRAFMSEVAL